VGLRYAEPSYETQSRLTGSALEKVPDSNAHDDHEDQDYEPSIHLLPLAICVRIETIAQSCFDCAPMALTQPCATIALSVSTVIASTVMSCASASPRLR